MYIIKRRLRQIGKMESLEQQIVCTTHILKNGLTLWLNEDHSQPKVFGAVVVKAGAKDCPNTGIAHYFEHMMFKGTDKIGTTNYEQEKVLLDQIAEKYDELAETKDKAARRALQLEINALSVKAAEYVVPNEFNRLISQYGGTKLNAGTSLDFTVYFNTFSPQYMEQWAEINSERLINPVFRLFQNELETVYEEKNMYADQIGGISVERLKERYFAPHPYAYPVIGSTENLKNPRLSEMRRFFEEYYVASNMGLILCGDFKIAEVLPILERAFSRIREGQNPKRKVIPLPKFNGKEKMKLKVPIPFVKMMALGFRGIPANHPDEIALKLAISLLNNANGTGFLDKLSIEHKVMATIVVSEAMNEAGILAIFVIPKFFFQTYAAAEKLIWNAIERLKAGEFSEEVFQSLKLEQKRDYVSALENVNTRAQIMVQVFSHGKTWDDYLAELTKIDKLSREDIITVAKKYFVKDYLYVTKTTGRYKKDNLPKPGYVPVRPQSSLNKSDFAKQLEKLPVSQQFPRFIDEKAYSIVTFSLSKWVNLYVVKNPVNDIFSLDLIYGIGTLEKPLLTPLANYLHFIGTEKEDFDLFRNRLQVLGSTLTFEATDTDFIVHITGFDANMQETIALVGSFMQNPKADKKQMHQVVNDMRVGEQAFRNSADSLGLALIERVTFGERSRFLQKPTLKEIRQIKGSELLALFQEIQQYACEVHYCGNRPIEEIRKLTEHYFRLQEIMYPSGYPCMRPLVVYESPCVYFLNKEDVSQSIVYAYILGKPIYNMIERAVSKLFSEYFGGDMSSLMFQEIREFRSYAYRVNGYYYTPSRLSRGCPGYFRALFSTQNDKTIDAMTIFKNLIERMPDRPECIDAVKQNIQNEVNNAFPSFRRLSTRVAKYRREGFDSDPNRELLANISHMQMTDIRRFYEEQIFGKPIVFAIVGNKKLVDLKKLAVFGEVIRVKQKDIFRYG